MKIIEVSVLIRDVPTTARFYADVLGLGVETKPGAVTVTIGATRLELVEDPDAEDDHHFAITIPRNKFDAAKTWIQQRAVLLRTAENDEFECSPSWNARSLYFAGPDRSVLELIVRRDLDNATPGPFTSADLLCVSEVGVAVADVPALVELLRDESDVAFYGSGQVRDFAPAGDADGMLILVSPGRTWFPIADRVARESQAAITAVGGRPGTYPLGALGSLRLLPS